MAWAGRKWEICQLSSHYGSQHSGWLSQGSTLHLVVYPASWWCASPPQSPDAPEEIPPCSMPDVWNEECPLQEVGVKDLKGAVCFWEHFERNCHFFHIKTGKPCLEKDEHHILLEPNLAIWLLGGRNFKESYRELSWFFWSLIIQIWRNMLLLTFHKIKFRKKRL